MSAKFISLDSNVRNLSKSATLHLNERSAASEREGRRIYRLGFGQSPFPIPGGVVQALKEHAHEKAYLPVAGLPELRETVAHFHQRHDGVTPHPEGVVIGPGSKELMFLLQLCFSGETILPTPCWVSYIPQARILGRKIQLLNTTFRDRWRLTPSHLATHLEGSGDHYRPRLLILNYPGNPEGLTYASSELQDLAELAKQYELIILSDEIYGPLHHRGEHTSIARFYPEGTIISTGLSKWCGAGGWRLGTFAFPPNLGWLAKAVEVVASETYSSVSAPIQYAAVRAFQEGKEIANYLGNVRRIVSALGQHCATYLNDAGIQVHHPEGAFYFFLDLSSLAGTLSEQGIATSPRLCERLLDETGVALLPGEHFGRPDSELTARLAYVDFDGAEALIAAGAIPQNQGLTEQFLQTYCARVTTAIDCISAWTSQLSGIGASTSGVHS